MFYVFKILRHNWLLRWIVVHFYQRNKSLCINGYKLNVCVRVTRKIIQCTINYYLIITLFITNIYHLVK